MTTDYISTSNLKDSIHELFISRYSALFNSLLLAFNNDTKHIIRNNKQLNQMYDLFLDYIIDSNQHLELHEAEKHIKQIINN